MPVACFRFEQIGIASEIARLPSLAAESFALAGSDGTLRTVAPNAAKYGLRSGMSVTSSRALCAGLVVLPYDQDAYAEAAETVWDLIAVETSIVEPSGAEICYAELTGSDVVSRCRRLACMIATAIGIPVAVGIGATKLVAQYAAHAEGRIVGIDIGTEAEFVADMPLALVAQIDGKVRERMKRLGLVSLGDLAKLPPRELERQFQRHAARTLSRLTQGLDDDPVRAVWPKPKIAQYATFEDETNDLPRIEAAIRLCAEIVAAKLLKANSYCRTLSLTVQRQDRTYLRDYERLVSPNQAVADIAKAGCRIFARLALEQSLLWLEISATDIDGGGGVQLALLDDNDGARSFPHERQRNMEACLRFLRRRYGPGAVVTASLLRHAQRIGFWTYTLAKLRSAEVRVAVDAKGVPISWSRRPSRREPYLTQYEVKRIVDRWRTMGWEWGKAAAVDCWRVDTCPDGTFDLQQIGIEWRLSGVAD